MKPDGTVSFALCKRRAKKIYNRLGHNPQKIKEKILEAQKQNIIETKINPANTFVGVDALVGMRGDCKRVWAMPNKWTFAIKPIKELLKKYNVGIGWVDPFAGQNSPAELTNDIEGRGANHQMDALDFLRMLPDKSARGILFDPPYSVEQCLRKYTPKFKGTAGRAEYWAKCKNEIARIIKSGGTVISFCWDSTGMGAKRNFGIIEILLVCHGACHNDTIITVEEKLEGLF